MAPHISDSTHLSLPALVTSTVPEYWKFLSHRSEQTKVTFVRSRNVPPTFSLNYIRISSTFYVYCLYSTYTQSIFCLRGLHSTYFVTLFHFALSTFCQYSLSSISNFWLFCLHFVCIVSIFSLYSVYLLFTFRVYSIHILHTFLTEHKNIKVPSVQHRTL